MFVSWLSLFLSLPLAAQFLWELINNYSNFYDRLIFHRAQPERILFIYSDDLVTYEYDSVVEAAAQQHYPTEYIANYE